jgi:tetratricopeptide (TPR) repeat protein
MGDGMDLDLSEFERALAERDLNHAAYHLAGAIAEDPLRAEIGDAVAALLAATDDPLALVPVEDGMFFGTTALRAAMMERLGDLSEAVWLLLNAQPAAPHVPLLSWADEWLARPGASQSLDAELVCSAAVEVLQPGDLRLARAFLPVLRHLRDRAHEAPIIATTLCRALRSAGELDVALDVAREVYARAPGYHSAVTLGATHDDRDEPEEAIAAYHTALAHDPDDVPVRLDLGDRLLGLARDDEAEAYYREVIAREPEHAWALPSLLFIAARRGDEAAEAHLSALADEGNRRAHALYVRLRPYVRSLPVPRSGLVDLAYGWDGEGDPVVTSVTSLEAPSAVLAFRTMFEERGSSSGEINCASDETWGPDPREPDGDVDFVLWRFDGALDPVPDVAEPAREVAEAVAALAELPYQQEAWHIAARATAASLDASSIESLLATMVHPPPRPDDVDAPQWLFRVQVASALTLGWIDHGWVGSRRRRVLLSLLHGPVDWTTTAAILALADVARADPSLLGPIALDTLLPLLDVPGLPIRTECIVAPVVHCLETLPGLPEPARARVREMAEDLRQ